MFTVILVALIFEYINGFHDTANSIATVVGTKALNPTQAVSLAVLTNLLWALWGTKVALTITLGLVDANDFQADPLRTDRRYRLESYYLLVRIDRRVVRRCGGGCRRLEGDHLVATSS